MKNPLHWTENEWQALSLQRTKERQWQTCYAQANTVQEQWPILREMYTTLLPDIMQAAQTYIRGTINRDILPWKMSPIEEPVWITIRGFGLPFYPQFPVEQYFLDFAHPLTKIGIELDGKAWHNPQKDALRDRRLMQCGWRIFRITGSEVYAGLKQQEPEDPEDFGQWLDSTYDGILTAIDRLYFYEDPWDWSHFDAAVRALHRHRIMPFPLITKRESSSHGQDWGDDWRVPDDDEMHWYHTREKERYG
jgi:very-short-patch-repair endonuclease